MTAHYVGMCVHPLMPGEREMNILRGCKAFIFDCDGVLWRGKHVFPYSTKLISKLRSQGKKVAYVTNNNSTTRKGLRQKLLDRGFDVDESECFCTSYIAAKYIKDLNLPGKIYLVGNPAMAAELDSFGINHFGLGPDQYPEHLHLHDVELPCTEGVSAVLVGYDRHLSLKKITNAMTYLRNPNILFIATNMDSIFPLQGGKFGPGTGTIVQSIITPSSRQPIVVGKPCKKLFELVQQSIGVTSDQCVMIGDRIDTDILFAQNSGIKSILVFSGVTSKQDYEKYLASGAICDGIICQPSITLNSIKDLLDHNVV